MGQPRCIIQVMDEHDLVLNPMVTWGSPLLRDNRMRKSSASLTAIPKDLSSSSSRSAGKSHKPDALDCSEVSGRHWKSDLAVS
eukprot:s247_g6.t1